MPNKIKLIQQNFIFFLLYGNLDYIWMDSWGEWKTSQLLSLKQTKFSGKKKYFPCWTRWPHPHWWSWDNATCICVRFLCWEVSFWKVGRVFIISEEPALTRTEKKFSKCLLKEWTSSSNLCVCGLLTRIQTFSLS